VKINITISGITPLLMNRFHEGAEIQVSGGTSVTFSGDKGSPREQATLKRYADTDGNLYIPGPNIFACLIAAGTFHKAGKSKLTTLRTSLIPAGIMVDDLACNLIDADGKPLTEWEVDSRSIVNPATGGRRMCYRPRVDVWNAAFTLDVDSTMFSPALVRAVVDDAGKKIGLGDFRPARKGPFGRFVVSRWDVVKDQGAFAKAA